MAIPLISSAKTFANYNTRDCQNAEPIWMSRNGGCVSLPRRFCNQAANDVSLAKRRTAPVFFCNGMAISLFRDGRRQG